MAHIALRDSVNPESTLEVNLYTQAIGSRISGLRVPQFCPPSCMSAKEAFHHEYALRGLWA